MKSHLHPAPIVSDEEIEYYGELYEKKQIAQTECINFECYMLREIMLKHRNMPKILPVQYKEVLNVLEQ